MIFANLSIKSRKKVVKNLKYLYLNANLQYMYRFYLLFLVALVSYSAQAQYTETINSNRPGFSQGAFAVGHGVLQLEAGPHYGQDSHNLTGVDTDIFGVNYELRYGLLIEQLEINLSGDFLSAKQQYTMAGMNQSYSFSNFKTNTLGVKYLVYDPSRAHYFDKPNLYSWKANHSFKWWTLIPAVSVYAGANLTFGDRPESYPFFGGERENISPKVALITQNNWGSFVFVMNFIADRLTEDHKRYAGIFTLTHTINRQISIFGEYQTIKDDFYSDDLFRLGGAYLLTPDLQFDVSGLVNFKDTPSRWQVGVGVSYRIDMHNIDEKIMAPKNKKEKPKKEEKEPKLDEPSNESGSN